VDDAINGHEWARGAIFHEVFVHSFQDSDGDGKGTSPASSPGSAAMPTGAAQEDTEETHRYLKELAAWVRVVKPDAVLPGAPFLYYGEEVGMRQPPNNDDEFKRTPMQWDATPGAGFTTGTPWQRLPKERAGLDVAAQRADPASLRSRYRDLIRVRHGSEAPWCRLAPPRAEVGLGRPGRRIPSPRGRPLRDSSNAIKCDSVLLMRKTTPRGPAPVRVAATRLPAPSSAAAGPAGPPFWRTRRGLELYAAHPLPGGRALEVRFRGGQAYRLTPAALGLEGKVILAAVGEDPRTLVVMRTGSEPAELPSTAVLAAAEPAYRAALTSKAETVGARVRALRLASGRKAAAVAEAAGLATSNYARLEAGTHEPRLATLRRVAEALGVPAADLLG